MDNKVKSYISYDFVSGSPARTNTFTIKVPCILRAITITVNNQQPDGVLLKEGVYVEITNFPNKPLTGYDSNNFTTSMTFRSSSSVHIPLNIYYNVNDVFNTLAALLGDADGATVVYEFEQLTC